MERPTQKIRELLEANGVTFKEVDHEAATTCEISAQQRGENLKVGGKTLLLKDKKDFRLFVISAERQVDNQKVRKILSSQKLRFASIEELKELAGVEKGALPPFGRPILPFDLYVDESVLENEKIAFNAGILTKSFILNTQEWLKLVEPIICQFAKQ